jgi:hypothetical protein
MVLNFLRECVGEPRVNRRIDIRIVRFCLSIKLVLMCFGSGLPILGFFSQRKKDQTDTLPLKFT